MAYRFKLNEPFEQGCRRIAREQIERAEFQLASPGDHAIPVHETRKCLKRMRALLRLVRPALGNHVFHSENAQLRAIAQLLSGARDRHVLMETVVKLETATKVLPKGTGEVLREVLQTANGERPPSVDAAVIKQAQSRLGDAKKRLARLRLLVSGFDAVGTGLAASYRSTRRDFRTAYAELTDDAFHEWRKGVQQHWRHMMLLSRAWPECMAARVKEARALSQLLGDDHDLSMLMAFLRSEPTGRISDEQCRVIDKLVRQRQQELRSIAYPFGSRLFAEGAKGLNRRVALYWEAAIALKDRLPDAEEAPVAAKARPAAPRRKRPAA